MPASLLSLVAELETRLLGSAPSPPLPADIAADIPVAETYVLFLFDGLGAAQVRRHGGPLAASMHKTLTAPFPSTTTVALASLATGLPPRRHGIIGHHMWWPEVEAVVNVLKWIYPGGGPAPVDTTDVLPSPNLWERLRSGGIEPITVQPAAFETSPLTRMLYRGCRVEPVATERELVAATLDLAAVGGRLIFTYLPHVDIAAHISGQTSDAHRHAMGIAADAWDRIALALPDGAAMVGTADHGHIDYPPSAKAFIDRPPGVDVFGDPRALFLRGSEALDHAARLADRHGGSWAAKDDIVGWLGDGPDHPDLGARLPDAAVLAGEGTVLIPSNMDRRLIGYHGGFAPDERDIPLLIAGRIEE